MSRPIKATPVLSQEDYYKLLEDLKNDEGKKIKIEVKKITPEVEERIRLEGPRWTNY